MTLEETLNQVAELAHEELHIVRKRAQEKTAARNHGHDFHEMQRAADRLDDYAPTNYGTSTTQSSAGAGVTRRLGRRLIARSRRHDWSGRWSRR